MKNNSQPLPTIKPDTPIENPGVHVIDNSRPSAQAEATKSLVTARPAQPRPMMSRDASIMSRLQSKLGNYKTATAPKDKGLALEGIATIVVENTKKEVLDTVLEFFKQNKDEAFLSESQALQGINSVKRAYATKAMVLYEVMMQLAKGSATPSSVNISVIRNIYNEDFANWLAFYLGRSKKRR